MLGADQGDVGDVLVQGNLLDGGGYALSGGADGTSGHAISGVRLLDNRFGRKFSPTCGAYGPIAHQRAPQITASGNRWADTGAPV
jgi:hypothetical protein